MGPETDIRKQDAFYEHLANCIRKGLSTAEMYRELSRVFPDHMPPSTNIVYSWLKTPTTWHGFLAHFGVEETMKLWCLRESQLRTTLQKRYKPQDFSEFLGRVVA